MDKMTTQQLLSAHSKLHDAAHALHLVWEAAYPNEIDLCHFTELELEKIIDTANLVHTELKNRQFK